MIGRDTKEAPKEEFDSHGIEKGDMVYYARIIPQNGIHDILDLKVRTVAKDFFCGTEKDTQQAFLFSYSKLNKNVFTNRQMALEYIKEVELGED